MLRRVMICHVLMSKQSRSGASQYLGPLQAKSSHRHVVFSRPADHAGLIVKAIGKADVNSGHSL